MTTSRTLLLLTLFSVALVTPRLCETGTNIVTQTYERASDYFWSHQDPYGPIAGKGDVFKYSPLFAAAYGPLAALPSVPQALVWAILNAFIFWLGILRWFRFYRGSSLWLWIGGILCSMELDGSLRYQQINALMAGFILIGMADFRDRRLERSGFVLALDANLKILPGLFGAAFLIPWNARYAWSLVGSSLLLLIFPALLLGFTANWNAHLHWAQALTQDLSTTGLLDIESVFQRWGLGATGSFLRGMTLVMSLILILRLRLKADSEWGLQFAIGAGCLLLLSPRTESPTFVLFAPAYLFLVARLEALSDVPRQVGLTVWAISAFLITVSFNDVWPKMIWDPRTLGFATKTIGVFALWGLSAVLSFVPAPQMLFRRNSLF